MPVLKPVLDKISSYFVGEFDKIIINSNGESDLVEFERKKSMEIPAKGVTELDRLAHFVNSVDNDCFIVPKSSFKMIPTKEVKRNEGFKGLKKD